MAKGMRKMSEGKIKVCIIGPVVTRKKTGGVATFTESLANGFHILGCNTKILTTGADKAETSEHVPIVSLRGNKLSFFINCKKILKEDIHDIIIGSTWYDFSLAVFPKIQGFKIHYLHGFGVPCDGMKKSIAIMVNDKLHKKYCRLVSNSSFTKMINEIFFNINVDKVVPIGISPIFRDVSVEENPRKFDFLYVGRIRYNKGLDKIINALAKLKLEGWTDLKLAVVGDGPARAECEKLASDLGINVFFAGKLDQLSTIEYYKNSKVFISLDTKEPYGQTFIEAVSCGCNIVCPTSGGQVEYLREYPEKVAYTIAYDISDIAYSMKKLLSIKNNIPKEVYKNHSYEKVAHSLISYYYESINA